MPSGSVVIRCRVSCWASVGFWSGLWDTSGGRDARGYTAKEGDSSGPSLQAQSLLLLNSLRPHTTTSRISISRFIYKYSVNPDYRVPPGGPWDTRRSSFPPIPHPRILNGTRTQTGILTHLETFS